MLHRNKHEIKQQRPNLKKSSEINSIGFRGLRILFKRNVLFCSSSFVE